MIKDEIKSIDDLLAAKDFRSAAVPMAAILNNTNYGESELASLCITLLNRQATGFFSILGEFSRRFPESLYPFQGFYASFLSMQKQYDAATEEARYYLRKAADQGFIQNENLEPLFRDGLLQALLCSQSSYVEAGARSYCLRILNFGMKWPALASYKTAFARQFQMIETELKDEALRKTDDLWENFFTKGDNAAELAELCKKKNLLQLSFRLDLLEAEIRHKGQLSFEEEFLKSVYSIQGQEARFLK